MKFKVDENLPVEAAGLLRRAGYDAVTVLDQRMKGASDSDVASVCRDEDRALITLDTDFADIRTYPPAQFPGLVVLHLSRQGKSHVLEVLERVINLFSSEPLERLLWIVDETRLKIRG